MNYANEEWHKITKEKLYELAVTRGFVDSQIAFMYKVPINTVRYKRYSFNIKREVTQNV